MVRSANLNIMQSTKCIGERDSSNKIERATHFRVFLLAYFTNFLVFEIRLQILDKFEANHCYKIDSV